MRMMNKNAATLKPRNQLPVKYAVMLEAPGGVQKSPDETRSESVKQRRKQGRKQGRKRGVSGGDGPK
ncbi:MAG: hypothetical protein ACLU9T_17820 [Blautia faecis]